MKILFVTNFINHHQVPLADELYNTPGIEYTFVATIPIPQNFKRAGYPDYSSKPYLLNAFESSKNKELAMRLTLEADVVIAGCESKEYVMPRIKEGKLTFRYDERWFKERPWYYSTPKDWISFYLNHIRFKSKPVYILAASAYTANDVYAIGAYRNKVYKWGYFTQVNYKIDVENQKKHLFDSSCRTLMWCARFLDWKHPELPVLLAKRLKEDGYKFIIDMYGSGEQFEKIQTLINDLQVQDQVKLRGNLPNDQILKQMHNHEIFLFTSDRNEGWGAVLNEAMSCGCAVVSSNLIGATPFLVENQHNGLVFNSEDLNSLYSQVKILFDSKELRVSLSKNAVLTMQTTWNAKNAAKQLLNLISALQNNNDYMIPSEGPCSRSYPIKNGY